MESISVALCTRNGARFLGEQLDSMAAQTVRIDEIVVGDDASTDTTRSVVEEWASRHPGVRVVLLVNDPPLGVSGNFERTMLACSGTVVVLSDQDDVWHPTKVERLLAVLDARPEVLLVHSDARLVDADGRPLGIGLLDSLEATSMERRGLVEDGGLEVLVRRNLITGATAAVRSELVRAAAPFPEHWVHDEWLAMVAACADGVALIDEPLVDYRQHGGNEIGAKAPTLRHRLGRLREPRGPRNRRLLMRTIELDERLGSGRVTMSGRAAALVAGRLEHERMRSSLPAARLRRIGPVVAAARAGRYRRFGRGAMDVLRDLVQPI